MTTRTVGLAPVGVLPEHQRQGIGSSLIRAGIGECRRASSGCIVVLGEPEYYSRFGFLPASRWNLRDEYGGGDAFQVMDIDALPMIRYAPEFSLVAQ